MSDRKNVFNGNMVQRLLDERGLKAIDLSRMTGMHRDSICKYINGKRNPDLTKVRRIADVLHVNISEISSFRDDDGKIIPIDDMNFGGENDLNAQPLYEFVAAELKRQVAETNQLAVAKRIGVSHSYINRLLGGDAAVCDIPFRALIRLCPQIIDRDIIHNRDNESDDLSVNQKLVAFVKTLNNSDSRKALGVLKLMFGER